MGIKKYNQYLIYLFELVNKTTLDFVNDKNKIMNRIRLAYDSYVNDVSNKVLVLRHKLDERKTCIIPYLYRSHELYIKKIKRRLYPLKYTNLNGVFLTITSNPNVCMSYKDMHTRLSKAWNRLNSYIKYKYGNIPYIKVIELTDSGLLHIHAVFIGIKYLINQDKLSKLLDKYGVGYVTHISYVQRGRSAMKYIMKYITKVHLNKLKTNSKYAFEYEPYYDLMALSTGLRARLFSISKLIDKPLSSNNINSGEWEYVTSYIDKRLGYGILDMSYIEYIYYS